MSTPNSQTTNLTPSSSCSPQASQCQRPHHPTPSRQQHQQQQQLLSEISPSHWISRTPSSRPSSAPGRVTQTSTTQESRLRSTVNTSQLAAEGGEHGVTRVTEPLSIRKCSTYPPPNVNWTAPEKIGYAQRVGAGYGYSYDGRDDTPERRTFPVVFVGSIVLGFFSTLITLVTQCLLSHTIDSLVPGYLWFAIALQLLIVITLGQALINGSSFLIPPIAHVCTIVIVLASLAIDKYIPSSSSGTPIQRAMASGWLLVLCIDLFWVVYISSSFSSCSCPTSSTASTNDSTPPHVQPQPRHTHTRSNSNHRGIWNRFARRSRDGTPTSGYRENPKGHLRRASNGTGTAPPLGGIRLAPIKSKLPTGDDDDEDRQSSTHVHPIPVPLTRPGFVPKVSSMSTTGHVPPDQVTCSSSESEYTATPSGSRYTLPHIAEVAEPPPALPSPSQAASAPPASPPGAPSSPTQAAAPPPPTANANSLALALAMGGESPSQLDPALAMIMEGMNGGSRTSAAVSEGRSIELLGGGGGGGSAESLAGGVGAAQAHPRQLAGQQSGPGVTFTLPVIRIDESPRGDGDSGRKGGVSRARALYSYHANPTEPNELSFAQGESLEILDQRHRWWSVRKEDGSVGIAPSNYLIFSDDF